MNRHTFWKLIEESRGEDQIARLTARLKQFSPHEISTFDAIIRTLLLQSYKRALWQAFADVVGFVSDDRFEYFRCWLIAQGEGIFLEVTTHPARVCEFVSKETDASLEELLYVANDAYEQVTGTELF
jgi:hypothetical protein